TSHSPPLQLPSASRREDRPEVTLPPRNRLDIALGPRYELEVLRQITALLPLWTERSFGYGITDSWDEIVETLQGAPTERRLLASWLNMLFRDRRAHAYTHQLTETEARMPREAWVRATDASDLVHGEVMSLRTTVLDHRRSIEISKLRAALQGQVIALQGQ
nr:hypothetical protein [Tanacetum cinerariifolium]